MREVQITRAKKESHTTHGGSVPRLCLVITANQDEASIGVLEWAKGRFSNQVTAAMVRCQL